MALVSVSVDQAVVTPTTAAAPTTTTETITSPRDGDLLMVTIGATTTTITVVRPGSEEAGDAITDYSTGAIVSTERWIPINRSWTDATTGNATVVFSQLTNVTARLVRHSVG